MWWEGTEEQTYPCGVVAGCQCADVVGVKLGGIGSDDVIALPVGLPWHIHRDALRSIGQCALAKGDAFAIDQSSGGCLLFWAHVCEAVDGDQDLTEVCKLRIGARHGGVAGEAITEIAFGIQRS